MGQSWNFTNIVSTEIGLVVEFRGYDIPSGDWSPPEGDDEREVIGVTVNDDEVQLHELKPEVVEWLYSIFQKDIDNVDVFNHDPY